MSRRSESQIANLTAEINDRQDSHDNAVQIVSMCLAKEKPKNNTLARVLMYANFKVHFISRDASGKTATQDLTHCPVLDQGK